MANFVYGLKIEADAASLPVAAEQAGAALDKVGAKAKAMGADTQKALTDMQALFAGTGAGFEQAAARMRTSAAAVPNSVAGIKSAIGDLGTETNRTVTQVIVPANDRMVNAWKLNRAGMMSLQASGVNTFQALAAGMDPMTVAMMQGAQVIGAVVQGGVSLKTILGTALPIISSVTLVLGGLGAALLDTSNHSDRLAEAQDKVAKAFEGSKVKADDLKGSLAALNAAQQAAAIGAIATAENDIRTERQKLQRLLDDQRAADQQQSAEGQMFTGPGTGQAFETDIARQRAIVQAMEAEFAQQVARFNEQRMAIAMLTRTGGPGVKEEPGVGFGADPSAGFGGMLRTTDAFQERARDAQKAIQEQVRALKEEAATLGLSSRERAVQVEMLKAEATAREGGTRVTETQRAAIRAATEASFDFASNQQLQNDLMREAASVFEATRTPAEQYAKTIGDLSGLLALGKIDQETFTRAVQASNRRLMETDPLLSRVSRGVDVLGDSILDMAHNGASGWDILTAGLREFERALFELGVKNPLLNALFDAGEPTLQAALEGWFGSGNSLNSTNPNLGYLQQQYPVGHRGGRGDQLTDRRWVHPAYFENAPRFHDGRLGDDEMAAVIKKNESIFTPRHLDNADRIFALLAERREAPVEVNIIDQRSGNAPAAQVSESRGPGGGRSVEVLLLDAVDKGIAGGRFDRSLGTSFNLSRTGTR